MRWWHHLHDYFLPHERNGYRPHVFGVTSVAALAIVMLVLELGFLAQIKFIFPNTEFLASVLPGVLATLTNDARASAGVPAVTRSPKLDEAARLAAIDMAEKGYFAHVSPDGKTPWYWLGQVGYAYSYAGENLAVNFSDSQTLQAAWMASPSHEANIVKPQYTQVGFGTADGTYDGKKTTFVVEFFATPLATSTVEAKPAPIAVAAPERVTLASTTAAILGAATPASAPRTNLKPAASPPAPILAHAGAPQANFADRLLSSPFTAMEFVLALLFALFAALVAASMVRHWRLPHPHVLVGGALLLALSFGLIALNPLLSGKVRVSAGDRYAASVFLSR